MRNTVIASFFHIGAINVGMLFFWLAGGLDGKIASEVLLFLPICVILVDLVISWDSYVRWFDLTSAVFAALCFGAAATATWYMVSNLPTLFGLIWAVSVLFQFVAFIGNVMIVGVASRPSHG